VTPLGQLFEVQVSNVCTTAKRVSNSLGFRIGLSAKSHLVLDGHKTNFGALAQEAWIVGGDCAFYCQGERFPALTYRPEEVAGKIGRGAVTEDSKMEDPKRYLCLEDDLKHG
ncbi:unnamed protein product, partial [Polarella glacialis]